jgi:hypothetical protein
MDSGEGGSQVKHLEKLKQQIRDRIDDPQARDLVAELGSSLAQLVERAFAGEKIELEITALRERSRQRLSAAHASELEQIVIGWAQSEAAKVARGVLGWWAPAGRA